MSSLKVTPMSPLIIWNITKSIEKNPGIDVKVALRAAQEKLDDASHDINNIISQYPEQRHLACALFAWRELGHNSSDSLYEFYVNHRKEEKDSEVGSSKLDSSYTNTQDDSIASCAEVKKNDWKVGPVVKIPAVINPQMEANNSWYRKVPISTKPLTEKYSFLYENKTNRMLPVETTVMRLDKPGHVAPSPIYVKCDDQNQSRRNPIDKDLMRKIDEVCCMESGCVEKLAAFDKTTKELRLRATQLARREAQRAELLERAEASWKELELGYQRRLRRAIEAEEDFNRQIQKSIDERNGYKSVCSTLAKDLKTRRDAAALGCQTLTQIEKEVYQRACKRLQLAEQAAREDALLAQAQCTAAQSDRDLQFKEEQARRKKSIMESELESSIALMNEVERAMRSELGGLRAQITHVSGELLEEDARTAGVKEQLTKLVTLKREMAEDLEGCREICDKKLQSKVDELAKKREQLEKLKEKTVACRCKQPKNASVVVKRTSSLAALCRCSPEEKFLESCSCTSLRSSLLTHLLSDLFEGLQSELPDTELAMPCQMLKCLEDKHNWDYPSNVKTNLRRFFSKLLVGELEIAIATSIETHHARWVGASCADAVQRSIPDFDPIGNDNWQQKALERRAQQLAECLAEKMLQERVDDIMQQAKDAVEAGPPPCMCDDRDKQNPQTITPDKQERDDNAPATFSCLVDGSRRNTVYTQLTQHKSNSQRKATQFKRANTNIFKSSAVTSQRPKTENKCLDTLSLQMPANLDFDNNTPDVLRQTMKDVSLLKAQMEEFQIMSIKRDDLVLLENNITKLIQQSTMGCDSSGIYSITAPPPPSETSFCKRVKSARNPGTQTSHAFGTPAVITVPRQVQSAKKKHADMNTVAKSPEKCKGKSYKRPGQSYAVNLCLCGETKTPKDILNQAKTKLNRKQKKAEEGKQALPKIIMKPSEDRKSPERDFCKSDCVCLNHNPSNSSIDLFLDTLAKWNDSLVDAHDKCNGKISNKDNKVKVNCSLDGNKTECNENIHYQSKLLMRKSTIATSNDVGSQNKNREAHPILATTESEYMGAVNLEKSNETFCRCVIAKEIKKSNGRDINNIIKSDFPIECLESCNCCSKHINEVNYAQLSLFDQSLLEQNTSSQFNNQAKLSGKENEAQQFSFNKSQIKRNTSAHIQTESPRTIIGDAQELITDADHKKYDIMLSNTGRGENTAILIKNEGVKEHTIRNENEGDDKHTSAFDHIVKNSKLFSSECDYEVKFLGVTLTNEISKNLDEPVCDKSTKKCSFSELYVTSPQIGCLDTNSQQKYWTGVRQPNTTGVPGKGTEIRHKTLPTYTQVPSHKSILSFSNLEHLLDRSFKKTMSDFNTNSEKKEQTNTFNKTNRDSTEACACCYNNNNMQESQELETKAFHLLGEHLKEKYDLFKENCKSSCMANDEENQSHSTVLKKIKKVISESTKAVSCNCENQNAEGPWNRVQDLLQEYLKIKINRVQCPCTSSSRTHTENIAPEITEKVLNLIHDDFKRLRELCGCDKLEALSSAKLTKPIKKDNQQTIPSNDANTMENKPCDSIRNLLIDEIIQTAEKRTEMKDQSSNYADNASFSSLIKIQDNESNDLIPIKIEKHETKSNEVISKVTDPGEESFNNDKKCVSFEPPLSFIGYTLECSCGKPPCYCVCSKSTVKKNLINDIWNSYTNRKVDVRNMSYIMDNVRKPNDAQLCSKHRLKDTETDTKFRDFESYATCEEEMILKEFDHNLDPEDQTTNTNYEEALVMKQNLNRDDPRSLFKYGSMSDPKLTDANFRSVHISNDINMAATRTRSETLQIVEGNLTDKNENCECETVPLCHVKMLIQNIEQKLDRRQCVCDSMHSNTCPVHSR